MKAPRLLFVVNDAAFFLSHRLPLALGALDAGYEVHVATPASAASATVAGHGLRHHVLDMRRGGQNPLADFRTLVSLGRLYRRLRPDIVHHVTVKPVLYGSLAARALAVPAVVNAVSGLGYLYLAGGWKARARRAMVSALYSAAFGHRNTRIIFQNTDDLAALCTTQAEREKATLIRGSGVDLECFRPAAEPDGSPVVMLAARLLWDKGVGDFVAAAELLRARGATARFVLVGAGDPANPSEVPAGTLRGWEGAGTVECWGQRDDMPEVLSRAHVVCLPSYREGMPKVLLEAAACGRPVVTTDVPGCRDAIVPGETGLLVPPGDPAALADAIATLLASPALRARMGRAGRSLAEREFDVRMVVDRTLRIYGELL